MVAPAGLRTASAPPPPPTRRAHHGLGKETYMIMQKIAGGAASDPNSTAVLTPAGAGLSNASRLTPELLGQIFCCLDLLTWAAAASVDRTWREVARSPATVRSLAARERLSPVLPALLRGPAVPGAYLTDALVAEVRLRARL